MTVKQKNVNRVLISSQSILTWTTEQADTGESTCSKTILMRPIFEEWMKPFYDMEFKTITIRNTGGTDHQSFDGAGLPGFQFIQDEIEYDRGYHTSMDTWERLLLPDLKQNAIITAWFAYNAAMRDQLMPRKPEMKYKQERRQMY